jgi:hypothetical protein
MRPEEKKSSKFGIVDIAQKCHFGIGRSAPYEERSRVDGIKEDK